MEEVIVKSTKSQLEEIKESMFWKDVQDELERLKEELNSEYDFVGEPKIETDDEGRRTKIYPSTAEALIHLGDIKGRKKSIEYFLMLPEIFLNILEGIKDDTRREPTD